MTSSTTIDHVIPESRCPQLGVFWHNLLPACMSCNSTHKGTQWSEELLRPDQDDVERYFDFDPETGEMRAAPELDDHGRRRAETTIEILGLNEGKRPHARRRRWRELEQLALAMGSFTLKPILEDVATGPYRFVAERLLAARLTEDL